MSRLPLGKIPLDILSEVIFKNLGAARKEVTLGPSAGIDGAVLNVGGKSLVTSMDPITGAVERIGWLSVNINANDIATFGVEPAFFLSCLMLPETANRTTVETITGQIHKAAKRLGIAVIGGHCEVTPQLKNTIAVGCAMGVTKKGKYVTAAGARAGDKLVLTKSAGLEGTAILASDRKRTIERFLSAAELRKARDLYGKISVVEDAITAFETDAVDGMHDPTEGGIAGGVHEIADASCLGVRILEDRIRVEPETLEICRFFKIDPLQLISSGALLISAKPRFAAKMISELDRKRIPAAVIGEFLPDLSDRLLVRKNGKIEALPRPLSDHLWRALSMVL